MFLSSRVNILELLHSDLFLMNFIIVYFVVTPNLNILVACPAARLHLLKEIFFSIFSFVCDDRPEFHSIIILIPETVIYLKFILSNFVEHSSALKFTWLICIKIDPFVEHFFGLIIFNQVVVNIVEGDDEVAKRLIFPRLLDLWIPVHLVVVVHPIPEIFLN